MCKETRKGWHKTSARHNSGMLIFAARVRLLADLLANPTVEVEDDGRDA